MLFERCQTDTLYLVKIVGEKITAAGVCTNSVWVGLVVVYAEPTAAFSFTPSIRH